MTAGSSTVNRKFPFVLFNSITRYFNPSSALKHITRNCSGHIIEPQHVISNNVAFFTSVDSDEPVQPPFKLVNSKCCLVSSLTFIGFSSN